MNVNHDWVWMTVLLHATSHSLQRSKRSQSSYCVKQSHIHTVVTGNEVRSAL